jgi:hypothetical protein
VRRHPLLIIQIRGRLPPINETNTPETELIFSLRVTTVHCLQFPFAEHSQRKKRQEHLPLNFAMASRLLDPCWMGGEVTFYLHEDESTIRQLFATRKILEGKSQYFAASNSYWARHHNLDNVGCRPAWNEGSSSPSARSSTSDDAPEKSDPCTPPNKRCRLDGDKLDDERIEIHLRQDKDDMDLPTLHNIVYFLYTGCVNLNFQPCKEDIDRYEFPPGFPAPVDHFLLYKNAKKFLIDDLAKYTLEVLKETENVGERLFRGHDDLRFCDELVDIYVDYLVSNYEDVKALEEWQAMEWDPECGDEIARFRWSLMLRIMGQLTVPAEAP